MKINALIVDDELKIGENLEILLEEYCSDVEVIGIAQTVDKAFELIDKHSPDLVFLDVRMKRETGFDLLEKFNKIDFGVVFTTAYSEYAIEAIKFSAIDYLLKPIDIEELQQSIKKAEERIIAKELPRDRIEVLFQNLKLTDSSNFKLALPTTKGLSFVKLSKILYCVGQNNYTEIYIQDKSKITVSKTLKEYDSMLSEYNFFRIHKSYLINLNEISEYIRGDGGYVIMNNKASLDVSKRRKAEFIKVISDFNS